MCKRNSERVKDIFTDFFFATSAGSRETSMDNERTLTWRTTAVTFCPWFTFTPVKEETKLNCDSVFLQHCQFCKVRENISISSLMHNRKHLMTLWGRLLWREPVILFCDVFGHSRSNNIPRIV